MQISVVLPMDTIYSVCISMVDTLNWPSIGILLDTQSILDISVKSQSTNFQSMQMSWSTPSWLSPNVDWVSVEMSIKMLITAWSRVLINTWPQILPLVHQIVHAYSCVKYVFLFIAADHVWKISMREFVLHYYLQVSKSRFKKKGCTWNYTLFYIVDKLKYTEK